MPVFALDKGLDFPPVQLAEPDGLLAVGGDLSRERLLSAYRNGIFPWYNDTQILWWSPNPRFVLFPSELKMSKSMQVLIKRNAFTFTMNKDFEQVIDHCQKVTRKEQSGTWISDAVKKAYTSLHVSGYAHSAEAWQNNELVGGLYGVRLGKVFFGESMFSRVSNASKYAFLQYVTQLKKEGVALIDCQVYTAHLESFGARMISRAQFINLLDKFQ